MLGTLEDGPEVRILSTVTGRKPRCRRTCVLSRQLWECFVSRSSLAWRIANLSTQTFHISCLSTHAFQRLLSWSCKSLALKSWLVRTLVSCRR